eukprot:5387333-Amphidinium_carterae.1
MNLASKVCYRFGTDKRHVCPQGFSSVKLELWGQTGGSAIVGLKELEAAGSTNKLNRSHLRGLRNER